MKKRNLVISFVLLLGLLGGSALFTISRSTANSNPRAGAEKGSANPLVAVNKKARAARSGDENAIRELVDEMFRSFDVAQEFGEIDESVKERLVQAEISHRTNRGKSSCSEYRIVHAVNLLADRVGAPHYTRTNVFEVRRLRSNVLITTPEMQEPRHKNDLSKAKKQNTMSPIETFFVAITLIQQKRHNPEYQLTNDEWIALHGGKRTSGTGQKFSDEMARRRVDSNRSEEVRRAVERGVSNMSPFELLSLPEELLNTLGIER